MNRLLKFLIIGLLILCHNVGYSQSVTVPTTLAGILSPTQQSVSPVVIRNTVTDVDPYTGKQVYVWGELVTGTSNRNIMCAIYDKDQNLLVTPFIVNNVVMAGDRAYQHVKINSNDGSFVVAWSSNQAGNWDVFAKKIYLNITNAQTPAISSNTTLYYDVAVNTNASLKPNTQYAPVPVFCGASGELLIGFSGIGINTTYEAYYQRFNYTGPTLTIVGGSTTPEIQLNVAMTNNQTMVSMEYSTYSSQLIVTYNSNASGSYDVIRRVLTYVSSSGIYNTDTETIVNTMTTADQQNGTIIINQSNGNYSISYQSDEQKAGWAVYDKIYSPTHAVVKDEYSISGLEVADNELNPKGIWDERTNVLVFFFDYYGGTTTNLWYSMFDGNNSYAMIGNATGITALGDTYGGYGAYYTPVYNPLSHKIYLAFDILTSAANSSIGYAAMIPYAHPSFNPALASSTIDNAMNWVDSKSFNAYGDVIGEARVYYDQFGKQLQTQSLNQDNNKILAQMPLYDNLDRPAIQTLSGVLTNGSTSFLYDQYFAAGGNATQSYLPSYWDGSTTITNPTSILNSYGIGQYYNGQNVSETGVGQTGFPYSRSKFSDAAPGGVMMQTLPGDQHHQGTGHESRSISLGVLNELDHYAKVRTANFMTATPCSTLSLQAIKTISTDPNGITSLIFTDKSGNTVATAKEGSSAQNIPAVAQVMDLMPNLYTMNLQIKDIATNPNYMIQYFQLFASGNIQVYDQTPGSASGNLLYPSFATAGTQVTPYPSMSPSLFDVSQVFVNYPYVTAIQIRSKSNFSVKYDWQTQNCASNCDNWNTLQATYYSGQQGIDLHIQANNNLTLTCGTANTNIQVTDLSSGTIVYTGTVSSFTSSSLALGYYRFMYGDVPCNAVYNNTTTQNIHITFNQYYQNFAYFFYDDAGRLKAKTAPLGVNVASTALPGYTDTYTYNTVGQVMSMTEVDAGTTNYLYKQDGQLRFSQNAKQAAAVPATFSFIEYDVYNRVDNSGEYVSSASLGSSPLQFQTWQQYNAGLPTAPFSSVCPVIESPFTESAGLGLGGEPGSNFVFFDEYSQVNYSELNPIYTTNATGGNVALKGTQRNTWNRVSSTVNAHGYQTFYSYDNEGRVEWMVQFLTGLGSKTIDYVYDQSGNLLQTIYQQNGGTERFEHVYKYDNLGRMKTAWTREATGMLKLHEKYYYYAHGPLKRKELAGNLNGSDLAGGKLQGIDYIYTVQGWLKGVNNSTLNAAQDPGQDGNTGSTNAGFCKDAFGMSMDYYNGDYTNSSISYFTPGAMIAYGLSGSTIPSAVSSALSGNLFNGSIRSISWLNGTSTAGSSPNQYAYNYDYKYQLTQATFGASILQASQYIFTPNSGGLYTMYTTYDLNGNLTDKSTLKSAGTENMVYAYTANTNKLSGLQIYSNAPTPVTRSYSYDNIGEMSNQTDGTAQKNVTYNVYGLVVNVKDANQNLIVAYEYNERGKRAKKYSYAIVNNVSSLAYTTWYVTDAAGNELSIYSTNQSTITTPTPLQTEIAVYGQSRAGIYNLSYSGTTTNQVTTYSLSGTAFNYEIKDHLGNVRVIISRNLNTNSTVNIMSWADYLPFGEVMQRSSITGYNDRYGYQGEFAECDPETATGAIGGWNSFDLRMYDANVGRWLSKDPKHQYYSPYLAMGNNPVSSTDPTGGIDDINYDTETGKTSTVDVPTSTYDRYFINNKLVGFGTKGNFTFSGEGTLVQKDGTNGGVYYTGPTSYISHILKFPNAPTRYLIVGKGSGAQGNAFLRWAVNFERTAGTEADASAHGIEIPTEDPYGIGKTNDYNPNSGTDRFSKWLNRPEHNTSEGHDLYKHDNGVITTPDGTYVNPDAVSPLDNVQPPPADYPY